MIIALDNKTRPDVEILAINIAGKSVDFKDIDGVCSCPYEAKDDIPTTEELAAAVSKVLGEA